MDVGRFEARWRQVRSAAGLVVITWTVLATPPHGVLTLAALALAAGGWLLRLVVDRFVLAGLAASALGGVVLTVTNPRSAAYGYVAAACITAGAQLPLRRSALVTAVIAAADAAAQLVLHRPAIWFAAMVLGLGVCWLAGVVRRQVAERADQGRLLLSETQHAAALAERARIAREIHDVLAHALAALSVQLETADALLEKGRIEPARDTVARARQLTREGLAETRRAIGALRGDALPLPSLLSGLLDSYAADTGAPVRSTVDGEVRELPPDVGLALYRTAQEALTNVRKHAPGAEVDARLVYDPKRVRLTVRSAGADAPAVGGPGGYGLTGLRERAELAGGTFAAGPDGTGWRVDVMIPA
jgi:signal transduction histidine kinase